MHVRSIVANDPSLAEIITTGFIIASPKGKREFTFIIFPDDDPNLSVETAPVKCGYATIQPILYKAKVLPFRTHICVAANQFAIHYAVYIRVRDKVVKAVPPLSKHIRVAASLKDTYEVSLLDSVAAEANMARI